MNFLLSHFVLYYNNPSMYKLYTSLNQNLYFCIKKKFHYCETFLIGERTGIRTPDTRLRRALLYPAELCTHIYGAGNEIRTRDFNLGKVALYR